MQPATTYPEKNTIQPEVKVSRHGPERRSGERIIASVKRNFWTLRIFWPVIVFQLFSFSK